jgi:hypothetical protein
MVVNFNLSARRLARAMQNEWDLIACIHIS